jgi:hypothetical protein
MSTRREHSPRKEVVCNKADIAKFPTDGTTLKRSGKKKKKKAAARDEVRETTKQQNRSNEDLEVEAALMGAIFPSCSKLNSF